MQLNDCLSKNDFVMVHKLTNNMIGIRTRDLHENNNFLSNEDAEKLANEILRLIKNNQ